MVLHDLELLNVLTFITLDFSCVGQYKCTDLEQTRIQTNVLNQREVYAGEGEWGRGSGGGEEGGRVFLGCEIVERETYLAVWVLVG